jgi:hypothetical protein
MKKRQRELFSWNVEGAAADRNPVLGSRPACFVVRVPARREQICIDLFAT